jgi:hypothetical protein
LPLLVALATILIAAGVDFDANYERLRTLPAERRKKLVENLNRFDAVLSVEQQKAVRELDRRIHALDPSQRTEYLAALRRYHNWLGRLSGDRREEILRTPASERLAAIGKIASLPRFKTLTDKTPPFLQIAEIGEYSPFELAAVYKIWQVLTPAQRKEVERPLNNAVRLQALFRIGETKKLGREILPEGYDEQKAIADLESHLRKGRLALVLDEPKKQARAAEIIRRQSINFYYLSAEKQAAIKRVAPERLEQFAASFPSWLQPTFEPYPPDEARRRLTIIYRLVFPPPSEIPPATRTSSGAPGSRGAPSPTKPGAGPPGGAARGRPGPPL